MNQKINDNGIISIWTISLFYVEYLIFMKVKDVTKYLESIAPLQLQESYDNSGLQVGDFNLK